jgi:hypothetical protein
VTQTLYLRNYQTLRGAGAYLSRLVYDPPAAGTPATAAAIAGIGINSGMVIRDLGVSFVNAAGQNTYRGIDLTATQLAKLTRIRVSLFHTGLYMSRGSAHLGAAGCWFNNVADVDFWSCKYSLDINDDVGYSSNNNNFQNLHANDVGVWQDGVAYRVRGYGHHLQNLYSGGLEGPGACCLEFGDTTDPKTGKGTGVAIAGNNLILGLYCESSPSYGIRVTNTTQGRGGNQVQGVHMDGAARIATVHDPWGKKVCRCSV